MPNILQYPISLLAAFKAGLIVVNIPPTSPPPVMLKMIKSTQAKGIILWNIMANPYAKI